MSAESSIVHAESRVERDARARDASPAPLPIAGVPAAGEWRCAEAACDAEDWVVLIVVSERLAADVPTRALRRE